MAGPPSDNLFITDLPVEFDEASIKSVFGAYGNIVSCRHLPPRAPGQTSCALIRFAQLSQAQWLVEHLNGNIPEGLTEPVQVKFAREPRQYAPVQPQPNQPPPPLEPPPSNVKPLRPPSGGDDWGWGNNWSAGGGNGPVAPSDNLYLTGLPAEADDALLFQIFGPYGNVISCKTLPPRQPGESAAALIRFATVPEAKWLVDNLHGNIPAGLTDPLTVRFAQPRNQQKGGTENAPRSPTQESSWGKASSPKGKESGFAPYDAKGQGKGKGNGKGDGSRSRCEVRTLLQVTLKSGIYPCGGGELPDVHCAYVKGLPFDTTDIDLYRIFAPFGAIAPKGVKAQLKVDGSCTGIGFVDFVDPADTQKAIAALSGLEMPDGSKLLVFVKNSTRKGGTKGMPNGKAPIENQMMDMGGSGESTDTWATQDNAIAAGAAWHPSQTS